MGAGIKHKGVKPSNILVLGDVMIFSDFGSARYHSSLSILKKLLTIAAATSDTVAMAVNPGP